MMYILVYFETGLGLTMFYEFMFSVINSDDDDNPIEFDSYLERAVYVCLWPFILYFIIRELIKF
jgi:hypothetical protein